MIKVDEYGIIIDTNRLGTAVLTTLKGLAYPFQCMWFGLPPVAFVMSKRYRQAEVKHLEYCIARLEADLHPERVYPEPGYIWAIECLKCPRWHHSRYYTVIHGGYYYPEVKLDDGTTVAMYRQKIVKYDAKEGRKR